MTRLESLVLKIRDSQADMETEDLIKEYLTERDTRSMFELTIMGESNFGRFAVKFDNEEAA